MEEKVYTEKDVEKIISECFSLGQGGWSGEDDRQEYYRMAKYFCSSLKEKA